ncbi:hypothetical protein ASD11_01280 [Aeromicrobium sp. Root495]|nr:hypothetical protein ASD11_01280 [Aeromicrobium sp. Root495]
MTDVDTLFGMAPRAPKKARSFRCDDATYDAAMAEAERRGEYLSEAMVQFLKDYAAHEDARAPSA